MDAALRRGISTAYYSVFHDLTWHTASHLLGSCPQEIQNEIRRSWSHGEILQLAKVDMAQVTQPGDVRSRLWEALELDLVGPVPGGDNRQSRSEFRRSSP